MLIYECEGVETEIKEWFETINIAGVQLNPQELLNAIFSGPFVTLAKAEFSNSQNANIQKWSAYIKGSANRQDFLERALDWVSKGDIGGYMSAHRNDNNINELKTYFNCVIDWVSTVFKDVKKEMQGLEWGRLYEQYHSKSYDPVKVSADVRRLYGDLYVKNRNAASSNIILGGLRRIRSCWMCACSTMPTKQSVYEKQTQRGRGEEQIQLPALRCRARREQEQDLQVRRNGRRPRFRMEQGRRKLGQELPNALHHPQSG